VFFNISMELVNAVSLILSVALPLGLGFLASFTGNGGDSDWYKQLKKPPWTPPNWVFPVTWTILYIMMGVAAWYVWLHGGFEKQGIVLGVYLFQLFLNLLWTPLFFGMHNLGAAFADIMLLWFAIATNIYLFWHVEPVAAYLLVPYIVWVTLASTINLYVWIHYVNDTQYHVTGQPDQHSKIS